MYESKYFNETFLKKGVHLFLKSWGWICCFEGTGEGYGGEFYCISYEIVRTQASEVILVHASRKGARWVGVMRR